MMFQESGTTYTIDRIHKLFNQIKPEIGDKLKIIDTRLQVFPIVSKKIQQDKKIDMSGNTFELVDIDSEGIYLQEVKSGKEFYLELGS